ncbi:hypothetical protein S7711_10835 [Stachybotrys chartarum IBT 7711]|uniref:Uncharacterized protein n=1 Tax=Stachybotrys chartarum (strain CBS 109288 / IBT 7711) TaxID=1280523 RepID=A0A084B5K1_STACB|nr:hypothetical protein S7711_10835 [Stachybotrys chartarum IBT 7711]
MAVVCLDIAVDHRIERLFKPVNRSGGDRSRHVELIAARGVELGKNPHGPEVRVTKELAGPPTKGGIAIVLQQPRDSHPFDEGLDAVIKDCRSLAALADVFKTVSDGTLDIRTDVTIVDLLSYLPNEVKDLDGNTLTEAFRTMTRIICEKEPEVMLCAGRLDFNERKGEAVKFESIGVGKQFGKDRRPATVRVHQGAHQSVSVRRVNGFHPSYAVNRRSDISVLRQLQLLIAAETCGVLRGDWKNQRWMDELRQNCQAISGPKKKVRRPLFNYQESYCRILDELKSAIRPLITDRSLRNAPAGMVYDKLLESNVTRYCNDASLALREMAKCKDNGSDGYSLTGAIAWTQWFAEACQVDIDHEANETEFLAYVKDMVPTIRGCILYKRSLRRGGRGDNGVLNLEAACETFLDFAKNVELLLGELLLKKEANEWDELAGMLSNVSLGRVAA